MKKVCICSSFKFYEQVLELEKRLRSENIVGLIPLPSQKYRKQEKPYEFVDNFYQIPEECKLEEARKMTLEHFERIDDSHIVCIVSPNGYIGKNVCIEAGYAYAKRKPIYSSSKLDDFSVMSLVNKILTIDELIKLLKE